MKKCYKHPKNLRNSNQNHSVNITRLMKMMHRHLMKKQTQSPKQTMGMVGTKLPLRHLKKARKMRSVLTSFKRHLLRIHAETILKITNSQSIKTRLQKPNYFLAMKRRAKINPSSTMLRLKPSQMNPALFIWIPTSHQNGTMRRREDNGSPQIICTLTSVVLAAIFS